MNLIPSVSIPPRVKRVFCWVFSPKSGLIILLVVLFAAFVAVMCCKDAEGYIGQLLGLSGKNETLTFLGLSMGGVLLALQAVIANIRAKAMETAAKEQAKANVYTEQGQRQERLKNAIEHLGDEKVSVRLGGAYELFHLAHDTEEKNQRQSILDILCAHIRQTTGDKKYQEDPKYKSKPSEEVQSLLTLLFVQDHDVFKGLHIDLQESWLNGANLRMAKLEKANLSRAYLQYAILNEANLQGANLEFAYLQNAHFTRARMQEACLLFAHLQGACIVAQMQGTVLHSAGLQGALLGQAYLQGSDLTWAEMQGADLGEAHMEGADLRNAHLEGAFIGKTNLQAANLDEANLRGATCLERENLTQFVEHITKFIDEQSDLSGVVFAGGLTQKSLATLLAGFSDNAATKLRTKLVPHVGKSVNHQVPENTGAITGSYTKKEAEQWIAEYNEAMGESSRESNS